MDVLLTCDRPVQLVKRHKVTKSTCAIFYISSFCNVKYQTMRTIGKTNSTIVSYQRLVWTYYLTIELSQDKFKEKYRKLLFHFFIQHKNTDIIVFTKRRG